MRPPWTTVWAVGLTELLCVALSLAFNGRIRIDIVVIGAVCAFVVERVVSRQQHRHAAELEGKVLARTAELHASNAALRAEVAERIRVEHQLLDAESQTAAGTVAATIVHEINNPLSAALGYVQLALELGDERGDGDLRARPMDDEMRSALDGAVDAIRQAAAVTDDLRTLTRPGAEPVGPVEIDGAVRSAVRLAGPSTRGSEVTVDVEPGLSATASRARLVQVLLNLIVNAARAGRPDVPNHIGVTARRGAEGVVVDVSDTGVGMTDDVRSRLFEPFFTTRAGSGGTGLGLYVSRSIVAGFGGRIEVRSTPGCGSTFRVVLPP